MTSLLISIFCLGCCVGIIYTYAVYRIVEHKYRKTMKKFEYYSFYGIDGDKTDKYLDDLGEDGWEVSAIIPRSSGFLVYLKRELP